MKAVSYVTCFMFCWTVGAVLDGNSRAAGLLSHIVHQDIEFHIDNNSAFDSLGPVTLAEESIGIWIDPIGTYCVHGHYEYLGSVYGRTCDLQSLSPYLILTVKKCHVPANHKWHNLCLIFLLWLLNLALNCWNNGSSSSQRKWHVSSVGRGFWDWVLVTSWLV